MSEARARQLECGATKALAEFLAQFDYDSLAPRLPALLTAQARFRTGQCGLSCRTRRGSGCESRRGSGLANFKRTEWSTAPTYQNESLPENCRMRLAFPVATDVTTPRLDGVVVVAPGVLSTG